MSNWKFRWNRAVQKEMPIMIGMLGSWKKREEEGKRDEFYPDRPAFAKVMAWQVGTESVPASAKLILKIV